MTRLRKSPARRGIRGTPCLFARAIFARANHALVSSDCDTRKRRSVHPFWLTAGRDRRGWNHNRLAARVKVTARLIGRRLTLFRRQDRDRNRVLLETADLQHEGLGRNLVLHGLADAVAAGRPAEGSWLEEMPILHHVDPAARGQADGIDAGL